MNRFALFSALTMTVNVLVLRQVSSFSATHRAIASTLSEALIHFDCDRIYVADEASDATFVFDKSLSQAQRPAILMLGDEDYFEYDIVNRFCTVYVLRKSETWIRKYFNEVCTSPAPNFL